MSGTSIIAQIFVPLSVFDKEYFFIVDLLDYWNTFDVFKYGLLYSENDFKH